MILSAFILLALFFAVYILMPFFEQDFRKKKLDAGTTEKENLGHRKDEILEAIRDLEYDYKMQKMTEQDYSQLKENLTREAVEIMKKIDSLENGSKPDALSQRKLV